MTLLETKEIRSLSLFEKLHFERNKHKLYSNFFVAAVYNNLDVITLSNALRNVLLEYPQFSCNIFGDDASELKLAQIDKIHFEDVVEFYDAPELDESNPIKLNQSVSQYIINQFFEFGVNKPLWKLCIVNKSTAIFFCNHLIFDGGSGANFHLVLLNHLNQLQGQQLTMQDILFDSAVDKVEKVYPAVNDSIYKPSVQLIISACFLEFAPDSIKKTFNYFKGFFVADNSGLVGESFLGKGVVELNHFAMRTTYIKVSNEELTLLLKVCKENKVLLTALITFCATSSISHITKGKDLIIGFPIGLRGKLATSGETDETFGLFVKGGSFSMPTPLEKLGIDWNHVIKIHKNIVDQVNSNQPLEMIGMLNYVDIANYLTDRLHKPPGDTVQISNLGLQKPEEHGPVKITDMYFNQCIGPGGGFVNMSIITTTTGGMNIALAYHPDDAEELLNSLDYISERLNNILEYS